MAPKEFKGNAGFYLWEALSPWVKLSHMVSNFLSAKHKGAESLKVFVNTSLAQVWEDEGERIDDITLLGRRENYGDVAPADVTVMTAGVDIQADRIEIDRIGWSTSEQMFGLGKVILTGDPTGDSIWDELDRILAEPLQHELFGEMPILAAGIDSSYLTQKVGWFCLPRQGRRIWAVKGVSGFGRPIWLRSKAKMKKLNLQFFNVGVDSAKEIIYSRLRIEDSEKPGYCHFNMSYDEEHFKQLTAEEVVTSYVKGRKTRGWRLKPGHKRNEALDMTVYAYAALEGLRLMKVSLRRRRGALLAGAGLTEDSPPPSRPPVMTPEPPANSVPSPSPLRHWPKKKTRKSFRIV